MRFSTPCEHVIWNVMPAFRRELALIMVEKHGLSQKQAAEKLGVTESAVSQYLKSKRGKNEVFNAKEKKKIEKLAKQLISSKQKMPGQTSKVCDLCKYMRKHKIIEVCE